MITLEIDNSTQYATAYDGDKPVATVQRRRVLEHGPAWKVFGLDGKLMFQTHVSSCNGEYLAKRIERILQKVI